MSEADIDAEIAGAAAEGLKPKPDGSPDVQGWLELVTKKRTSRWTSTATTWFGRSGAEEARPEQGPSDRRRPPQGLRGELRPAGPLPGHRARHAAQGPASLREGAENNTAEHFGELAAQYSVEPGSQALRGEIPPIKRHGGQPQLEEEAFALKPGELSGIIQVGDKFVILRCEGRTQPVVTNFAEVRDEIYRDLYEKKLQLAMAEKFERLAGGGRRRQLPGRHEPLAQAVRQAGFSPRRPHPPADTGRVTHDECHAKT